MRAILLTGGKEAVVDDRDYDYLMQWKWRDSLAGPVRSEGKQTILMKRVVARQAGLRLTLTLADCMAYYKAKGYRRLTQARVGLKRWDRVNWSNIVVCKDGNPLNVMRDNLALFTVTGARMHR